MRFFIVFTLYSFKIPFNYYILKYVIFLKKSFTSISL